MRRAALCIVVLSLACDGRSSKHQTPDDAAVPVPGDAAVPVPRDAVAPDAAVDAAPPASIRLLAVGDVMFGRYDLDKQYVPVARESPPFVHVGELLRGGDIAFGNLECAMVAEPPQFYTHRVLTFRAEPSDAAVLAGAGFDVMALANNHARDFGWDAIPAGRRHLEAAGIAAVGAGATPEEAAAPVVIERGGIRVAFLAWTVWLQGRDPRDDRPVAHVSNRDLTSTVIAAVTELRARDIADAIVVSLHWGMEYDPHPRGSQRKAARAMIDAGVDVILGHHAHVVQDIERHGDGVIAYSLGNFLFDNPRLNQRRTVVLEVALERRGTDVRVGDVVVHPVLTDREHRVPGFPRGRAYLAWRRTLQQYAPGAMIADEVPGPERHARTAGAQR